MNLLEMYKQLNDEEKEEFISLIKKEMETVITVNTSTTDIIFEKMNLAKSQLFGQ